MTKPHLPDGNSPAKTLTTAFILWVSLCTISTPTEAKFYKCKNPDGSTSYSQTACTEDQTRSRLDPTLTQSHQSGPGPEVCGKVRNLAERMAGYMHQGVESDAIYDAIGGMYNVEGYAHAIIAYIYSFKHNPRISTARIAGLSYSKCMAGGFDIKGTGKNGPAIAGRSGSGFAIAANGIVLTNAHVVSECRHITLTTADGRSASARTIDKDEQLDLALLSSQLKLTAANFRTQPLPLGAPVAIAGFPLQGLLASQLNITGGNVSALAGTGNNMHLLQFTAPTQPGNSGGPLLDEFGAIGGIVTAKLNHAMTTLKGGAPSENVNFAVKSAPVLDYLARSKIKPGQKQGGPSLPMTQLAEQAKQFTVQIHCQ